MHEVLVNRLGGLSLPRKSVVRLTDRPDMTLDVYRGRKNNNTTTISLRNLYLQLERSFLESFADVNPPVVCFGSVKFHLEVRLLSYRSTL